MDSMGRGLMLLGLIIFLVGAAIYLAVRVGIPLGRLPGDIQIGGTKLTCIFPVATSLLLSVILSVILTLLARYLNR